MCSLTPLQGIYENSTLLAYSSSTLTPSVGYFQSLIFSARRWILVPGKDIVFHLSQQVLTKIGSGEYLKFVTSGDQN